jgi:hypothetical protein
VPNEPVTGSPNGRCFLRVTSILWRAAAVEEVQTVDNANTRVGCRIVGAAQRLLGLDFLFAASSSLTEAR